jgi:trigger factor
VSRDAKLKVLVKSVRAKRLPAVTDEWVSDVSEYDTVEELTDRIRTNLSVIKLNGADSAFRNKLLEEISEELSLEVPSALVDAEFEASLHSLAHNLEDQGIDFPDYLRITGQTEQQFVEGLRGRSERSLRTRILLDSVVAIEGLELADGELDEAIAAMADDVNQDAAALKQSLVTSGRVAVLTGDILRQKALDRIVASAEAIDQEGQHIDLRPSEIADDTEQNVAEDDEPEADED